MAAVVVIPARLASTRFPEKILASETGKPLVQHVVEQAAKAKRISQVIVAVDDQRIVEALRQVMTSAEGSINLKAGTNEECDSIGHGEAIAAHAVVLLGRGIL